MAPKQAKSCGVKKKAPKACGVKKEATVDARRKTKKQPAVAAQDDDWDKLFATAGPKTLEEVDQWPQQMSFIHSCHSFMLVCCNGGRDIVQGKVQFDLSFGSNSFVRVSNNGHGDIAKSSSCSRCSS